MIGEAAQRGRRAGEDVGGEVLDRGERRLERCAAAYGQPDVGDGGVRERVQDEQEAGVELTGVEEVGDPVPGPQACVDHPGAEGADELLPFLAGVAGEPRRPRGAARLEHDAFPEGGGQDAVVVQGIGGPEPVLVHDGNIGDPAHVRRQVRVEVGIERRRVTGETHEV